MTREQAERVVDALVDDLTDRRGLRHEWDQIDEDIQEEIKGAWVAIVMLKGTE